MLLCAVVLLSGGCATDDPLKGAYWAETDAGWPALCVPGKTVRCLQPSPEDREHFKSAICGIEPSEI